MPKIYLGKLVEILILETRNDITIGYLTTKKREQRDKQTSRHIQTD